MRSCFFPLLVFLFSGQAQAQYLPDTTQQKIDKLFQRWDSETSPGCAVGIIRNDSLIFSKGYGLANLEYSAPNTPATIFHVASVSKQFTGYAIVLLARQGRLRLDDDVRQYLPWFPDLGETITIRHLLNHTSGIRDQWQLLATAGTRLDDVITQEQIIKVLSRQRALNSKPGERYNYCNSGYTMLAEIVKAVSGKTLRQFTDSAIFKPLKMNSTHFHDDYTEIVKGRSYSYQRKNGNQFANSVLSYSNTGATSLFTTVEDLSKWIMNFYDPKAGDAQDIVQLTEKGRLNSGKVIDYALGIGNFTYKGWRGFVHNGADAGYRTTLLVCPDLKLGCVVLANVGDFNPGARAEELMALFVEEKEAATKKNAARPDSSQAILGNPASMQRFEGSYISDEGTQMAFRVTDNKFYADAFGRSELLKGDGGTFSALANPVQQYAFTAKPGDTTVLVTFGPGETALLQKYSAPPATERELKAYEGTYYCPELDCNYGIALKNKQLVLTSNKYTDMPLRFAGPDHLHSNYWWMSHLRVLRNAKKEIEGFEVNDGRVLHLRFNKL
ncbi:serine hydrolase domain-containing protein [Chitinophaga alhagiae]|uniref:serine hydrolase domain-containing protein n=1 Tax=Chitinophaga alhagiae TaxID=2203219 RepID=UPI000E5B3E00|nr:serine hydrolase domain-containing protein [Chitinophaga alhagiae]